MITLITGKPRSGKSYYSVKYIRDKYFIKEKGKPWEPKEGYLIVTNIDGLNLPAKDLKTIMRNNGKTFKSFFEYEYQKELTEQIGKKIVYVLDECQQYINPFFKDAQTILYFDMHGHLGHHVILITQDRIKISKQIAALVEKEYRFIQRSLLITSTHFKYKELIAGDVIDKKSVKVDKSVFDLYTSQFEEEPEKPKNNHLKFIIIPIIGLCISACMLRQRFQHDPPKEEKKVVVKEEKKQPLKSSFKNEFRNPKKREFEKKANWVSISYVKQNDKFYGLVDPVTDQLLPPSVYPYKIKVAGRHVWADIPNYTSKEGLQNENRRNGNKENKARFSFN